MINNIVYKIAKNKKDIILIKYNKISIKIIILIEIQN